jgi:hypothetical protein
MDFQFESQEVSGQDEDQVLEQTLRDREQKINLLNHHKQVFFG